MFANLDTALQSLSSSLAETPWGQRRAESHPPKGHQGEGPASARVALSSTASLGAGGYLDSTGAFPCNAQDSHPPSPVTTAPRKKSGLGDGHSKARMSPAP